MIDKSKFPVRKIIKRPNLVGNKNGQKHDIDYNKLIAMREEGMSFSEIGRRIGLDRCVIKYHMNKIGFEKSRPENYRFLRHEYDESYFEKIDTPEKAYFLGLLYADGNNYVGNGRHAISIGLKSCDGYIIEYFRKAIRFSKELNISKSSSGNDVTVLSLSSKKWSNDLIKLGCVPAKSFILKFPIEEQVPYDLLPHLLRGVFDGDGCIYKYKKTDRNRVYIVSSKDFVEGIQSYLSSRGINSTIYPDGNIFRLYIFRLIDVELFKELIYPPDTTIKLERKYKRFLNQY